jgi:formylglycine-generating enzyme required for sulfatase activity
MKPKLLILIVLFSAIALAAAPQGSKKPLTKDEIIALVKGGVPGARVVGLVQQNGIDFEPTEDYFRALRTARADPSIINAVRAARPAKPPAPAGATQATVLIKAANTLMDTGDIDGAITLYKEAIQNSPNDSEPHRLLGIALGKKKDWQGDAAEQRAAILANPDDAAAKAELTVALRASTEALTSELVVESSAGAEVYLDDEFKGRTGPEGRLKIENLKSGAHALRVSLPQKKAFEQTVKLVAGEPWTVHATFADLRGKIVIQTNAGAQVFLDNKSQGTADASGGLTIPDAPLGSHQLRISAANKQDLQQTITVSAGQEFRFDAPLLDAGGRIVVQTTPGAQVFVDNASRGTADAGGILAVPDVGGGTFTLRISAKGKKDFQQSVKVTAGGETHIDAPLADLATTAGMVVQNPKDGLKYAWIPPGTFQMGCSPSDEECNGTFKAAKRAAERPVHPLTLTKGFWMAQTEATVGAYKRFSAATGRQMPAPPTYNSNWVNDRLPIVNVTWNDAHDYCAWAGGRLPTEAEWEYAARGGSADPSYGPLDEVAWYEANSGNQAHAVGEKRANGFGLYDVLGNALEWVNDWYEDKYYKGSPSQDPVGPPSGTKRALRGGCWDQKPEAVRVSNRGGYDPNGKFPEWGFRCVSDALNP